MTQARAELMREVALFASLPDAALAEIAEASRSREAAASETFFREAEPAESFFVMQSGSVKLTQITPEGHQVVLRLVGPGDAFGGVAAFGGATYPVTAEAVTHVLAFEWPGSVMATLIERHPKLATEKVERRIARALARLTAQSGRRIEAGVLLDLPLTREDLAQMTGTTLYTVSRVVSRWEEDGIVEVGRQRIVVRDPGRLMSVADDLPQTPRKS